jgi:hypothetical protein
MATVLPTVPASDPNVSPTYPQVLATRDSSENTLRKRESLKTGQDSNFDDGNHHKNENGDNDAEERAPGGRVKPVGFWDPLLATTRKWGPPTLGEDEYVQCRCHNRAPGLTLQY